MLYFNNKVNAKKFFFFQLLFYLYLCTLEINP